MTHGGGDNFDHLVKVLSDRFLHYKATVFSFLLKYLWEDTFWLCEYPVYQHIFTHWFNIHQWLLPVSVIPIVFASGDLLFLSTLLISWNATIRKNFSFSPDLFIYFYQQRLTDSYFIL